MDTGFGAFRIDVQPESRMSRSERAYYECVRDRGKSAFRKRRRHPPPRPSDALCEGDAQPAIRLALQQGRLLDFFQIVEQVLSTYNPSSAYVSLEDWEGSTCDRCGDMANSDDARECKGCESLICGGCVYQCRECQEMYCGDCDNLCDGAVTLCAIRA